MKNKCKHGFIISHCSACRGIKTMSKSQHKRICIQSECVIRKDLEAKIALLQEVVNDITKISDEEYFKVSVECSDVLDKVNASISKLEVKE